MEGDFNIESKYPASEIFSVIGQYLNETDTDLDLTRSNDTYYIQKKTTNYFNRHYMTFLMLQLEVKGNLDCSTLVVTSQTKWVGLLMKVMFIPLIWIFILVFSIREPANALLLICCGVLGTAILFVVQQRSKKLEARIVSGLQVLLE